MSIGEMIYKLILVVCFAGCLGLVGYILVDLVRQTIRRRRSKHGQ